MTVTGDSFSRSGEAAMRCGGDHILCSFHDDGDQRLLLQIRRSSDEVRRRPSPVLFSSRRREATSWTALVSGRNQNRSALFSAGNQRRCLSQGDRDEALRAGRQLRKARSAWPGRKRNPENDFRKKFPWSTGIHGTSPLQVEQSLLLGPADITEDQFDFRSYCLRKMTLRTYVEMLKFQDRLHSYAYFRKAAVGAISQQQSPNSNRMRKLTGSTVICGKRKLQLQEKG